MIDERVVVNGFAGPGGWCEGVRAAGFRGRMVGIEWDKDACLTGAAAGHLRVRADVATYPLDVFKQVWGLIMSPPCQAWSMAGKQGGEQDRAQCHQLADAFAAGESPYFIDGDWADDRSRLVAEPVRWVRALKPEWVLLEQVPPVLGLWEHFARIFRGWGYSVWTGVLRSDAYGVPQTRSRAILIARRDGKAAQPPAPTHALWPNEPEPDLFGDGLKRWVSMAEALGWDGSVGFPRRADQCASVTLDGVDYRARDLHDVERPSPVVTEKARSWLRMGTGDNATVRSGDEPAPTVFFGARLNTVEWVLPAVEMMAAGQTGESRARDPLVDPSATLTGKGTAAWVSGGPLKSESVRVQVWEAGVLQSFRPDYPWQGTKTKQFEQVGNAVPVGLAAAIVSTVLA